jgi:hypothetical protein
MNRQLSVPDKSLLALFGRGNQADIGQQTYRIYRIGVLTRAADRELPAQQGAVFKKALTAHCKATPKFY